MHCKQVTQSWGCVGTISTYPHPNPQVRATRPPGADSAFQRHQVQEFSPITKPAFNFLNSLLGSTPPSAPPLCLSTHTHTLAQLHTSPAMAVISNQANYSNCRVLGRKGPTYTPTAEILSSRALSGADTPVLSGNCVPTAPDGSPPHHHQRRKDPRHGTGGRELFPIPKMLQTSSLSQPSNWAT